MSETRGQYDQLLELAALICDDQADAAAIARLDEMLAADPEARQVYLRYVDLHMDLGRRMEPAEVVPLRVQGSGFRVQVGLWAIALAAAVALAATVWFALLPEPRTLNPEPSAATHGVAVLTNTDHVTWAENSAGATLGSDLPAGLLKLESGTAQIMFKSGAVVDLAGPAELRLDGVNLAHLNYGSMRAYVPQRARGFTVNTRQGLRVVDLGTEFVLWAADDDRCRMHVLSGQVLVFEVDGAQQRFVKVLNAQQGAERTAAGRMIVHEQTDSAFREPWTRLGMIASRGTILGTGVEALLGGDSTDPENDGDPDRNVNYNATFFGNDEADFGASEAAFNVFDNRLGAGNNKWCCGNSSTLQSDGLIVGARFAQPGILTHFTVTSSNDMPRRDPVHWKIQGSIDGQTWVDIFEQDDERSLWTQRNQVIRFDEGADYARQTAPYAWYRYIALETAGRYLDGEAPGEHALGEIELFIRSTSETKPAGDDHDT